MSTNVYAIPAQNFPGCPTCCHDWHGVACTQTKWITGANRPGPCPCETSINTEMDAA